MRLTRVLGVTAAASGVLLVGALCSKSYARMAPPKPLVTVDPATLPTLPADAGDGDYAVGPDYTNAPELTLKAGTPQGMVYRFVMSSTDSQYYPGISKAQPGVVPYHRRVSVYVPANYVEGKPLPFLVSQDSMGAGEIPTILDNMISEKRLPEMAAIFIDSGGGDAQGSERGLEYDTVSGKYAEFIQNEVIPRVESQFHVTLTKNPDGRMAMGGSSGAACAFTMAWYHPEWYHKLVLYSSTLVNQQSPLNPASPHGAWEYHDNFIPKQKTKPLRIWDEVGEHDLRYMDPESTYHNWVMANLRFAAVLKEKHYHYQFVFAKDAGHVDGKCVRQTLPEALEYVWKGYKK